MDIGFSIAANASTFASNCLSILLLKFTATIAAADAAKTAREIKAEIGSCKPFADEGYFEVRGRHTSTGLPKNVNISAKEVREAMGDVINSIVDAVLDTLEDTPPELAADVLANGIVITGGGAGIRGIDALIEEATGVKTRIADNADTCVCRGALTALSEPSVINRSDAARKR